MNSVPDSTVEGGQADDDEDLDALIALCDDDDDDDDDDDNDNASDDSNQQVNSTAPSARDQGSLNASSKPIASALVDDISNRMSSTMPAVLSKTVKNVAGHNILRKENSSSAESQKLSAARKLGQNSQGSNKEKNHHPPSTSQTSKYSKPSSRAVVGRYKHVPGATSINEGALRANAKVDSNTKTFKLKKTAVEGQVEEFSGIRVQNRTIGLLDMRKHMKGRLNIKIGKLEQTPRATLEDTSRDWVMIGGLYEKSPIRTSSSGKQYQIWTIGDLKGSSVSVFMFDEAFHLHKAMPRGTLLAFLNARLLPARSSASMALSIKSSEQAINLGKCSDMGTCRSLRKDGKRCTMVVNVRECKYCEYHVNAQYKKLTSGRMDLAGSRGGSQKNVSTAKKGSSAWDNLRKSWSAGRNAGRASFSSCSMNNDGRSKNGIVGVPRHYSSGTYEIPGLGATSISGRGHVMSGKAKPQAALRASSAARAEQLRNLAMTRFRGGGLSSQRLKAALSQQNGSKRGVHQRLSGMAEMLGVGNSGIPRGDVNSVGRHGNVKKSKKRPRHVHDPLGIALGETVSSSNQTRRNAKRRKSERNHESVAVGVDSNKELHTDGKTPATSKKKARYIHPKTAASIEPNQLSDYGTSSSTVGWNYPPKAHIESERRRESQLEASYREEEEQRQRRSRINAMKKARLAAALKNKSMKFVEPGSSSEMSSSRICKSTSSSTSGVSFGPSVDLESQAGQTLLKRKSINSSIGSAARVSDTMNYLHYLEGQEKMMTKMEKVTSIKTKAVRCRTCNTITTSSSSICIAERHQLEEITATKRFFECQQCGRRDTSLNKKFMSTCCANCGQAAWRRTSMRGASKRTKRHNSGMQVRGPAHGSELRGRAY